MLIEDNLELAQVYMRQLERLNYKATLATDGRSAFEAADTTGGFDIVLSDVLLADGERGPFIVDKLVKRYPKTKVVFMTGYTADGGEGLDNASKNRAVLLKPFRTDELAKALKGMGQTEG